MIEKKVVGNNPTPRLFSLDLIRALSLLAVVLFHFNMEIYQNYSGSMMLGSLMYAGQTVGDVAISMFIIVSGLSLALTNPNTFNAKTFFKKRFLAIYPSFWIAYAVVGVGIFLIKGHFVGDGQHWKLLLSFVGLDGFFLYKMQNYYLVGEWYTGYMLLTYLAFPLLFIGSIKSPVVTWALVMIIFFLVGINYHALFQVYINCNPLMRLPDFLFGITYSLFIVKFKQRRFIMFLAGVLVLGIIIPLHDSIMPQLYMFLFGAAFFSIIVCMGELAKTVFLCEPITAFIAKHSFMAFLLHHQILYYLFSIVDYPHLTRAEAFYFYGIIVGLSLLGAVILSPVIDRFTKFLSVKILPKAA